jgi:proline iminopeptidase
LEQNTGELVFYHRTRILQLEIRKKENLMKRSLKIIGFIIGGLLLAGITGLVVLFVFTSGDYEVPATVVDDPNLSQIEVLGIQLHAETYGDPEDSVVIVLHGGPGADYQSLLGLQALSDEYYVVFYDQRGAGLSERVPAEQLNIEGYLKELDAIVDLYGSGEPVNIIGHSWGAMLLSAYLGYAPENVEKAVLAEPGFLNMEEFQAWMDYQTQFYASLDYLWFSTRTGFEAQHVDGPDENAADDYLYTQVVHYFSDHPDNPYHCPGEPYDAPIWRFGATASKASRQASPDEINSLESGADVYEKPVLFLAGECNTWIGPELQAKHADQYADSELITISNAGHDMFWDNPGETLLAVRSFLQE